MMLTDAPSIDAHIDLIPATCMGTQTRWLHSSPEYAMKRLLAEGYGDIYQLGHVFRDGEVGARHNLEFTMAEWYRLGFTLKQMMDETCAFIQLFLGELEIEYLSYQEAFERHLNLNPLEASKEALLKAIGNDGYSGLAEEGRDALLNILLATHIEKHLGTNKLTTLYHFPASQAALARTNGPVAERFEVYHNGQELCNGYHELADGAEQRRRFALANELRSKPLLPYDEPFLKALDHLPDCCGVAVGFDRLMMLRHKVNHIDAVIPDQEQESDP